MSINLLPWRNELNKKKLIFSILRLMTFFVICVVAIWISTRFYEQQANFIFKEKQKTEKLKNDIDKMQKDIASYQEHNNINMNWKVMSSHLLNHLFTVLNEIPLNEGELTSLHLKFDILSVAGYVMSQKEFDLLKKYLESQDRIEQVKLVNFSVKNELLLFQLDLYIKDF